jgi:cation diffusion facilitator family transporter
MSSHSPSASPAPRAALGWALFALGASLTLTFAKFAAWALTGSTSMLSDALESIINVVTSAFALFSVWLATQPRDHDHPYGHGRVEYFSAGLEGALISFAALAIFWVAVPRLLHPAPLEHLDVGLVISLAIGAATWASGAALQRAGRRLQSPTLVADGAHLTSDAWTTFGVAVGLVLVRLTGASWLDPLGGIVMAAWLLFTGTRIVRSSVGALMDEAVPGLVDEIGEVLESVRKPGWVAPHHTKVHRLGQSIHIDLHLVLPRFWSLEHAHEVSERIERAAEARFGPATDVMTHLEPCDDRACGECDLEQCPIRRLPFSARPAWKAGVIDRPYRHGVESTHSHGVVDAD